MKRLEESPKPNKKTEESKIVGSEQIPVVTYYKQPTPKIEIPKAGNYYKNDSFSTFRTMKSQFKTYQPILS